MLVKIKAVVQTVRFINEFFEVDCTGAKIASNLQFMGSRSTAYRWINKAQKAGFIDYFAAGNVRSWYVTPKGENFLEAWHELPF